MKIVSYNYRKAKNFLYLRENWRMHMDCKKLSRQQITFFVLARMYEIASLFKLLFQSNVFDILTDMLHIPAEVFNILAKVFNISTKVLIF